MTAEELATQDREETHYRPQGGPVWCNAQSRQNRRVKAGEIYETESKVEASSDVTRVTCPDCRKIITRIVRGWQSEPSQSGRV